MKFIAYVLLFFVFLSVSLRSVNAQQDLEVIMGRLTMPQEETGLYSFIIRNIGDNIVYSVQAEIVEPNDMIVIGSWVVSLSDMNPNQQKEAFFTLKAPSNASVGDHTPLFRVTYENPKGTKHTWNNLQGTVTITLAETGDYSKDTKAGNSRLDLVFITILIAVIVGFSILGGFELGKRISHTQKQSS